MSLNLMCAGESIEFPLGYIFEFDPTGITNAPDLSTAAKVHDYFGYGTWEAYGAGRVMIGVNSGHAVGSEGGEEKHTLIITELPSKIGPLANIMLDISNNRGGFGGPITSVPAGTYMSRPGPITIEGGDQPHNNMQPYRTVYRWRRIA